MLTEKAGMGSGHGSWATGPSLLRIEGAVAGAPAATLTDSLCRGGSVLSAGGTPDSKLGSP